MTWLGRRTPVEGEGPNAFVLRVAEANHLPPRQLLDVGIEGCWPTMDDLHERMLPFLRKSAAYCPICLGSDRVGRLGWELTFADACGKCGSWLVDVCATCGGRLSWHRERLLACDCGQQLCDQTVAPAPVELVRLSQRLERSISASEPIGDGAFERLDTRQLSRFVRLLGSYGASDGRQRPQKGAFSSSLAASWPISTLAAQVISDWPSGFHRLLAALARRSPSTESGSLPRVFGGFYLALYRGFKEPVFDFARLAFEDYALEHWTGAMARRNRRFRTDLLARMKWEPASHACARLGVSRRRLAAMVEAGLVKGAQRTTGGGRQFLVIHREHSERVLCAIAAEYTLVEAARRLGLKRSRFAALLPLICPDATKHVDQHSPWAIPGAWLDQWTRRLDLCALVSESPGQISLARILRFLMWPGERVARLLVEVLSGDLPVVGRTSDVEGIPSLVFEETALDVWVSKGPSSTSAMTVPQLAVRIGVKQEVAYLLVRRGLLKSTVRREAARPVSLVSETQLRQFNSTYVWGRELACLLGKSPKAAAAALTAAGISAASGPGVDGGRQLLFSRAEVSSALQMDIPTHRA